LVIAVLAVAGLAGGLVLLLQDGSGGPAAIRAPHATASAVSLTFIRPHLTRSTGRSAATPAAARLAVSAARGDSWVVIRAVSAQGRLLFAGTLGHGQSVRRSGARLWVELGAASNVDVTVDGKHPRRALSGTMDALVTAAGLREVPVNR
jgi:hypothetical protein